MNIRKRVKKWLKKGMSLLLTLAILAPLCFVPTQAATVERTYTVYLRLKDSKYGWYTLSVGGSAVTYSVKVNVPSYATKTEIMPLIEDAAEESIVINVNGIGGGPIKGLLVRSKSCWNPDYDYSVVLCVGSGTENVSYAYSGAVPANAPSVPAEALQKYSASVSVAASPSLPGYDFSGWTTSDAVISNGSFAMPDSHAVTLSGSWTPRTDTPYIVERYQQNTDNDGYSLQDADHYTGTTDTIAPVPQKDYLGFTVKPPTPNVPIQSNGSTVLKLYYDRNVDTVSYAYANQAHVLPPALPAAGNYRYGQTVALATVPTLPGYDFGGWTTTNATISGSSFTMPAHNVVLSGSYIPRADTPYTVEFYKQDAPRSTYTKQTMDTITSSGTTDTQIRAALNMTALNGKYAQYSLTDASKNDATTINGNGGSVLRLYYDKTAANVSYLYNGSVPMAAPTAPVTVERQINTSVSVEQAPTLAGYDFSGWTTTDAAINGGSFIMPVNDVTLTGSWTPRTDTPYTVERYQQNTDDDNYALADTEHCTGTTDTVAVVPGKSYPGFTVTPESLADTSTVAIRGDETTLLKLYYDRNVNSVSYSYSGETDTTATTLPAGESYRFGQTVPVAAAPSLTGYDFGGWETSDATIAGGSFTMPDAPVNITGAWTAKANTPYVVKYYQQNTDDDAYTLAFTFNGTGVTGTGVPHKEFEGFTQTPDSLTTEGSAKIRSDGSTVLKLYYDRNTETVTYTYSGEIDTTPPQLPSPASYRFGQTVAVAGAPTLPGYDFGGWETSDAPVVGGNFTMPDAAVSLTGAWATRTDIPYVIEYHQQNTKDNGYTLAETLNGEGAIGGSIPHREFEGFTETPDSVTAEGNARIRSDGSTVLKLYYDRDYYAVSFAYSGSAPEAAPTLPDRANYRYGVSVSLPIIPGAVGGMSFSGWTADSVQILGNTLSVPAQDTQITGDWTPLFDSGDALAPAAPVTLEDNGTAYIIGYEDGAFRPDDYLTAKHETLMLSRLGLPVTQPRAASERFIEESYITRKEFLGALLDASGAPVKDSEPMAKAVALGWISGYGDGGLYPDAYITRAQAVTIINRAFGRTAAQSGSTQISYTDIPRDYWAYDAIMAASTTA